MAQSLNSMMDAALCNLATANDKLTQAKHRLREARADEVFHTNQVNDAQKKLDELIASLKKDAPLDTDWGRARNPPQPAIG